MAHPHRVSLGRGEQSLQFPPGSSPGRAGSGSDEVDEHVELPLLARARIPNVLHPIALFGGVRLDRALAVLVADSHYGGSHPVAQSYSGPARMPSLDAGRAV